MAGQYGFTGIYIFHSLGYIGGGMAIWFNTKSGQKKWIDNF